MSDPPVPGHPGPTNADNEDWWPGYPDDNFMYRNPAFTVQRDVLSNIQGGDYTRGSTDSTLAQTALRFPIGSVDVAAEVSNRGVLYTRVYDYNTIEIFWGIPDRMFHNWAEVSIVRSAFGYPETVNDGQTLYRKRKDEIFPNGMPEDFVLKPLYDALNPGQAGPNKAKLTGGRYYYYSLFFRINLQWARSFTSGSLLPRNFGHAEHLWDAIPPYYQWTDDQHRNKDGDLRRFLKLFGFELDTWREYVENWQELYHIDFCPTPLLRRLGPNLGVPYESGGIGDIRYRSLLAEIGRLYEIRGTRPCLELVCESVSKYECDVNQTGNLMTLPDDSDFFEGTGNWAGYNTIYNVDTILGTEEDPDVTILEPDEVFLDNTSLVVPPVNFGRSVMEVWSDQDEGLDEGDDLTDIFITCGSGVAYDAYNGKDEEGNDILPYGPRYIYPIEAGILADTDGVYCFSVYVKMEVPTPVDVMMLWYGGAGGIDDYLDKSTASPSSPIDTAWKAYQVVGTVPEDAVYLVPAIHLPGRLAGPATATDKSPSVYFAGAAVYLFGDASRIASGGLNPYLQLGYVKKIGLPTDTPPEVEPPLPVPFPGYQLGRKTKKTTT